MRLHKSDLEDDIAAYIRERMPEYDMLVLVDCGANVGWFTYQFLKAYPTVRAYCLEPVPSIALGLSSNLARFPELLPANRVTLHQVAVSDKPGSAFMTNEPDVTVNRIVPPGTTGLVQVTVTTGDAFCSTHSISTISFLKIDCEGFDDKVLEGFGQMIAEGRVDFIQVEAGIGQAHGLHRPLSWFEEYLIPRGFRHFRFVNQASDGPACLSRADAVFIRHTLAVAYGGQATCRDL